MPDLDMLATPTAADRTSAGSGCRAGRSLPVRCPCRARVAASTPAAVANISPVRWPGVPLPAEPKIRFAGVLARAVAPARGPSGHRNVRMHRPTRPVRCDQGDRREVPDRIVRQLLVQRRVDGVRADGAHQQRVAVRRGLRNHVGADGAAGTAAVVDDHCCFSASPSICASGRATMSVGPPAEKGRPGESAATENRRPSPGREAGAMKRRSRKPPARSRGESSCPSHRLPLSWLSWPGHLRPTTSAQDLDPPARGR